MPKIAQVRCVLLSAPYADPDNREIKACFPASGHKTAGMVELTLEDGTTGLGEGYLAVFAPKVFEAMVNLIAPYLIGQEADAVGERVRDLAKVCDYWSMQGAARHVISACEIALIDVQAKRLGLPAYKLLGARTSQPIPLYGSGGDADTPDGQLAELDRLASLGIGLFKTRGRNWEVRRTAWILQQAGERGLAVGVDMAQNLANPGQSVSDVIRFLEQVGRLTDQPIHFLEEALGPMDIDGFRLLRQKVTPQICGGETITTPAELARRMGAGVYDFAQPDATVLGGITSALEVFTACRNYGSRAVVHAWGGGVGLMANYHAAFAGGGELAEYPLPRFPLREALMTEPLRIEAGRLQPPQAPGVGVHLTHEIEYRFPFREDAVYCCVPPPPGTWSADAAWG